MCGHEVPGMILLQTPVFLELTERGHV